MTSTSFRGKETKTPEKTTSNQIPHPQPTKTLAKVTDFKWLPSLK